jgi:hypothetical protein
MLDMNGGHSRDIRRHLRDIDKGFDIGFDYETESYHILHKGPDDDEYQIFQVVPYGDVTRELLAEIRHTVWLNKEGKMLEWIDEQNEQKDVQEDKRTSDMAYGLANDLRKTLLADYYYGKR